MKKLALLLILLALAAVAADLTVTTMTVSGQLNVGTPVQQTNAVAANPFPTNVAGLAVRLEADLLSASNNDPISSWDDVTAFGNDFSAESDARPVFKTGIVNGYAAVLFDGSDDVLTNRGAFLTTHFAGNDKSATFVVLAARTSVAGSDTYVGVGADTAPQDDYWVAFGNDTKRAILQKNHQGDAYPTLDDASGPITNWLVMSFICDGVNAAIRTNGAFSVSGSVDAGSITVDNLSVGGLFRTTLSLPFVGYIQSVLIYTNAVGTNDIDDIESYLMTKAGL